MNFCTLFLCALRSVTVLLHLCTSFSSYSIRSFVFYAVCAACGGHFFLLMGDSLVQYRAAIGLFNCFKFVSGFIVFFCLQYYLVLFLWS